MDQLNKAEEIARVIRGQEGVDCQGSAVCYRL